MKRTSSRLPTPPTVPATAKSSSKDTRDVIVATGKRLPPAPIYLGKHGRTAYDQCVQTLRDLGIEDAADARAVEAFASAYEDFREAREVVDEQGMTYKTFTSAGELKFVKRPEVDVMADAWKRVSSLLPQLCMTPVSRTKGKPKGGEDEPADPFSKFLPAVN